MFMGDLEKPSAVHSIENQTIILLCHVSAGNPRVHSLTLSCEFPISDSGENQLTVQGNSYAITQLVSPDMIGKSCQCVGHHLTGLVTSSPLILGVTGSWFHFIK